MDRSGIIASMHHLGYDEDYCTQLLQTFAGGAELMDTDSFAQMWAHLTPLVIADCQLAEPSSPQPTAQVSGIVSAGEQLPAGCRVCVTGLQGAPQHNGKRGEVVAFDASTDRYRVQLDSGGHELAMRRPNLVRIFEELRPVPESGLDQAGGRAVAAAEQEQPSLTVACCQATWATPSDRGRVAFDAAISIGKMMIFLPLLILTALVVFVLPMIACISTIGDSFVCIPPIATPVTVAVICGICWACRRAWRHVTDTLGVAPCDSTRQRYRTLKSSLDDRQLAALRRGCYLVLLLMIICCHQIYLECGEHGGWGVGSCNCADGFGGDRCWAASAYAVSGATDDRYNGRYERLPPRYDCTDLGPFGNTWGWRAPSYVRLEVEGRHGYEYVLFSTGSWAVGNRTKNPAGCAGEKESIFLANWDPCKTPDDSDCVGGWRQYRDHGGSNDRVPVSLVVSACLAEDLCCGVNCGAHGTLNSGSGISSESSCCHCADGYTGERCELQQLPPLPAGMAEAYAISGAAFDVNGVYERLAAECNGKPVYQRGDLVLFRPTNNGTSWVVGPSDNRASCAVVDYTRLSAVCWVWGPSFSQHEASPDGSGCVGVGTPGPWRRYTGSDNVPQGERWRWWQESPSLSVTPSSPTPRTVATVETVDADDFGASFSVDFPWGGLIWVCFCLCFFSSMIVLIGENSSNPGELFSPGLA
jgi:hypothetical protein